MNGSPKLTPGNGFKLQPDGQWKAEQIPSEVLKDAQFSGYLTIKGYRSTVFDTPDGGQWAQKSMNTPVNASVSPLAKRVAARWLKAQQDIVTQLKSGLEKDEMAAWNKAAQEFAGKVKEYLPDLDKAHTTAVGDIEKTVEKFPKASHPRVDGYEAQELQTIMHEYIEALRAAKQKFDEAIMAKLQEFVPGEPTEPTEE
jgi:hypothetical protein